MKKNSWKTIACSTLFFIATNAFAAPQITLSVIAEKDVEVTDENGNITIERQEVTDAAPGETIYYTLSYGNTGDESAHNIKLDNPIADGNLYVDGSAWGDNAEILFSTDNGQTFKEPAALSYSGQDGVSGKVENKKTNPESYTHIRWLIKDIAPGSNGTAGFNALVE